MTRQNECEMKMMNAVNQARKEDRFDFMWLYRELEKIASTYLKDGTIKEGHTFTVPMERPELRMTLEFYNKGTAVRKTSAQDTKYLVHRDSSARYETNQLAAYEDGLKDAGFGIGRPYPLELKQFLFEREAGDVLTFGNGKSFVLITDRCGKSTLVQTCEAITTPKLSEFENTKVYTLDKTSEADMQQFFNDVVDLDMSYSLLCKVTKFSETIDKLKAEANLEPGQSKLMQIGVEQLLLTREGDTFKWYQGNSQVSNDDVATMSAWIKTSPVMIDFVRNEEPSEEILFLDQTEKSIIKNSIAELDFNAIYKELTQYSKQNPGILTIQLDSYDPNSLAPVELVFKDGQAHNVNHEIGEQILTPISDKQCIMLFEKIMDYNFRMSEEKIEHAYGETYDSTVLENRRRIALEEAKTILKNAITEHDVKASDPIAYALMQKQEGKNKSGFTIKGKDSIEQEER